MNSLDAQRLFCEKYIASQAGEGWTSLTTRYDDGGFSGGSLDRPAAQRLMADVDAGEVDVVVVYKIDRLSRSLMDFSSLIGRFDAHGVSLVSVTQAFNTSHSMGRLTLNVLLSFAQFERELASERLRDKAAASRALGLWQNGQRPYGYQLDRGKLIVDAAEAKTIRFVYRRYVQVRSTRVIAQELDRKGIRNKVGTSFTATSIAKMLRNRLYRGDLVHQGRPIPGIHEAIITESLWINARKVVAQVVLEHRPATRPYVPNPLRGLIFSAAGKLYSQNAHHNRYGKLFRYYLPSGRKRYGPANDPRDRFRADLFDEAVLHAVAAFVPTQDRGKERGLRLNAMRLLISKIEVGEHEMNIALHNGAVLTAHVVGRVRKTRPRSAPVRPQAEPSHHADHGTDARQHGPSQAASERSLIPTPTPG